MEQEERCMQTEDDALPKEDKLIELQFYCDNLRHLVCEPYTIENLHKMAALLNIKRCWFHNNSHPHYDIPKRRITEITEQCTLVPSKEILMIIKSS